MTTSLDITGKIDAATVELLRTVSRTIEALGIPYVVVGATARDLVLHHGYGADLERATQDIDFAIEVPDWAAFNALADTLVENGFKPTRAPHRLISPADTIIDIVPFGQVEDADASIAWPPEGKDVMNVLGFQEACDNAVRVRIADEPELVVLVANPAGMALLKLIAWTDRARDKRGKDALDLAYLLASYERIPAVQEVLYDDAGIMESYGWDIVLAAAHRLGQDAAGIAGERTRAGIGRLMRGELRERSPEQLITEMCGSRAVTRYEKNERLLAAFWAGFGIMATEPQ
jgi:predicted nucleotidyltransferase